MLFNESSGITVQPHISERWSDFEVLFGSRGACGGCWCRWFRLKRSDYEKQKGESNRHAMKAIVDTGEIPGILAYQDDHPVVWCSIGLREMFPLLNRSRILKPVDAKPLWSIVCQFIRKKFMRQRTATRLLHESVEFA